MFSWTQIFIVSSFGYFIANFPVIMCSISVNALSIIGFTVNTNSLKFLEDNPNKSYIMITSHTSVVDFIVGLLIYYGYLGKKHSIYVLMKKEFEYFVSPVLHIFDKRFKLIPVEKGNSGLINQIVSFVSSENKINPAPFYISLTPEGTRRLTEKIHTGYWILSKELNLDVVFVGIDFYDKRIFFEEPREVKDNWEEEKKMFIKSVERYVPVFPEKCYWVKHYYDLE